MPCSKVVPKREPYFNGWYLKGVFNKFLEFKILEGYGTVSRKQAKEKAFMEYDKYNKQQHIESYFDREIKRQLKLKKIHYSCHSDKDEARCLSCRKPSYNSYL